MKSDNKDEKMLYFWVSDYTLNTAGLVYHQANKLQYTVNAWEKKVIFFVYSLAVRFYIISFNSSLS